MMDSQENTPLKGKIDEENQTEQSVVSGESVPVEITTTDEQSEHEPKEIHEDAVISQKETEQPSESALDAAQQTVIESKVTDTDQIQNVEDSDVSDSESQTSEEKTQEEELVEDILNIIHVFSCKINGIRSHIKKKIIERLSKNE